MPDLQRTCLYHLHHALGAKMVPFAGYEMPVQYPEGVLKEHLHTRRLAGLFDVSHMGQILLQGLPVDDIAAQLERLIPVDIVGLKPGRQRYGFFTNEEGGILDDLMIVRRETDFLLVVNAACKNADLQHLQNHLSCKIIPLVDRGLVALQGPAAETALGRIIPDIVQMRFLDARTFSSDFGTLFVTRSGYTGEDGFEISISQEHAESFARTLLAMDEVAAIGLGARDSLRLEAGLCLYGSDIDTTTSPIEAGLSWAIQKIRRSAGLREGGFPGDLRILHELQNGPKRQRVGLQPEGRAPMRAGVLLFSTADSDKPIGHITSGAFGPSLERPVAMGYINSESTKEGTQIFGELRGKRLPITVVALPFYQTGYKR